MTCISTLSPQPLWQIFHRMTQSPRPSKHEEAILQSLEALCDQHNLSHQRDEIGNLIIRKPATPGMENRKGVIMQGHVDMVPQKNADSNHDFEKDPIKAYIDSDWVTAEGTTLGSDNGIGVAAALAVLTSTDIHHGPVEILLTVDEEAGMTGAAALKPGWLEGEILLNLDTEDEGELYVGCAGGVDVSAKVPMQWEVLEGDFMAFEIAIRGLRGGHSGLDIDKGRGNANKFINRFLMENLDDLEIKAFEFNGGTLRNAIPRESFTKIVLPQTKKSEFQSRLTNFIQTMQTEFGSVEPNLSIEALAIDCPQQVYSKESLHRVIRSVGACISGVTRMSPEFEGVVETSNNLAVVKSEDGHVSVLSLVRSLTNSARDDLANNIAATFALTGATTQISGDYPGWKPNPDSKILTTMIKGYENLYGKTPEVKVIHAGLECGVIGEPYPHWDMISFGPTIRHAHSPDEKVHIASVEKFWTFLVDTLKNIPSK
ncbi:MAG: aminoacyl-histidine dipeptidase [Kangiellaceae bacterium]|nr:aminoacyl-histidine dipeptidase [Kangiellaceae bacterium]MCW9018368.1 aminoacyl-histidine dipeptidase [Kangiellaceae bacterium]